MSSLIPETRRPGVGTSLGNHEARVRALERSRSGGGAPSNVIFGAVADDGTTLVAGSGDWTCEWSGTVGAPGYPATNLYTITFDTPLSSDPVVLLTANNQDPPEPESEGSYFVSLITRGVDYIVVEVKDLDGNPFDGGFDFEVEN